MSKQHSIRAARKTFNEKIINRAKWNAKQADKMARKQSS